MVILLLILPVIQRVGKLLDFEYTDDDIASLRKQMRDLASHPSPSKHTFSLPGEYQHAPAPTDQAPHNPPLSPDSSELSDVPPRPAKKQRLSMSTLSDADDHHASAVEDEDAQNEEDEDEVLHSTLDPRRSSHAGKKSAPGLSLAHALKTARTPQLSSASRTLPNDGSSTGKTTNGKKVNGTVNGQHESRVKEEQLDEGQLKRLAAGVTVDSAGTGAMPIGVSAEFLCTRTGLMSTRNLAARKT